MASVNGAVLFRMGMILNSKLLRAALFLVITLTFWSAAVVAQDDPPPFTAPDAASPDISSDALDILTVPMTSAELSELATLWQDHLRSHLEDIAQLNVELLTASGARAETVRSEVTALTEAQQDLQENYNIVINAWQRKGGAEEDLAPHQTYLDALRVETVRTTDPRALLSLALGWATSREGGLGFLLKAAGFVVALWILMFIARLLKRGAERGLKRIPDLSRLLLAFLTNAVYWGTVGLGVLIVLGLFGVNVTPLFAVFGGLSFILGFALQDTLGNLASGLMIMILKPFDTGDYIEVGTASGFVDEMSVVSTQIRTFDNQIIVVPNSKIWGDIITNVSASAERRVDLVFGIAYSDNASDAIAVLKSLVEAHPMCLKEPEPEIFVGALGDSSVNIYCRPWTKSDDYWTVYWDLTGQAKERFDQEGISIPFPQRDVHLIKAET